MGLLHVVAWRPLRHFRSSTRETSMSSECTAHGSSMDAHLFLFVYFRREPPTYFILSV